MNKPDWTFAETLACLQYIAHSPPKDVGGFHQNAIDTAKAASYYLEEMQKSLTQASLAIGNALISQSLNGLQDTHKELASLLIRARSA